ncbi:MAG TPA: hypothetical protein VMG12_20270 [Polyangiaceae bacterium]|nr:hypothetical protein [Polyangiaceae bacterium]
MNAAKRVAARATLTVGFGLVLGCAAQPVGPVESAPALVDTAPASDSAAPANEALPSISAEADTSLALAVYRAAGVPDIDRAWSVRDYERCLGVFADLLRSGRSDLPRRGSQRSGALFHHLVALENFRAAGEAAPPETARRLQGYLEVYPGLLQIYSPANDGIDFSVEQTELIVSLFELLKSALDSSRPIAATDATWADVYARQQQMTLGVVRGASAMLSEPERYAPTLRQYLKAALVRLAPAFEGHLEPDAASEVRAIAAATPSGASGSAARSMVDSEPLR